jgi:hypothetical protein
MGGRDKGFRRLGSPTVHPVVVVSKKGGACCPARLSAIAMLQASPYGNVGVYRSLLL